MLYRFLIAPVRNSLEKITKLILIPDETLSEIPFETLLSDTAGTANDHYLIRDFGIVYHFSATLWLKYLPDKGTLLSKIRGPVSFIGYSPGFPSETNALACADEEIMKVARILRERGDEAVTVLHDDATEANFKEHISSYSLIHLATHSQVDRYHPEKSGLLFTDDPASGKDMSVTNSVLYLGEIYNLRLHAGLVVLSACATGAGKIIRSEGAMSLARGFYYAGAYNILYSLWNITDRHTRDFMIGFYTGLVSGMSYAEALRAEKLKMISRPETSLPVIWAPYILTGR